MIGLLGRRSMAGQDGWKGGSCGISQDSEREKGEGKKNYMQ